MWENQLISMELEGVEYKEEDKTQVVLEIEEKRFLANHELSRVEF